MTWLLVIVVVVLLGALVVVLADRGAPMGPVDDDRPDLPLPIDRPLEADDLRAISFTTAVRGYRMDQVDAVLARLTAELRERTPGSPSAPAPPSTEPGARHAG